MDGGKDDDGLIQRFQLLVWPDTPTKWRNVDRARLIATEACRATENGAEFIERVEHETGMRLEIIDRVRGYTEEAGRDPSALGMEGRISLLGTGPDDWITQVKGWEEAGATHVSVGTSGGPLTSPREHIEAIQRFQQVVQ